MKKKTSLLLILLLIITPFLGLVEIPIVEASPAAVVIDTSEASAPTYGPVQRKLVRGSDGTLYAVYEKNVAGVWHIYIKHSTNYGVNWTGETRISIPGDDTEAYTWPSIAVDSDDYLHVVFLGFPSGESRSRVWYSKYTTSWSTPITLNTGATLDKGQENPMIVADSLDNIHIVWSGSMPDTPTRNDIYYINYTDTWSDQLIISNITGVDGGGRYASMAMGSNDVIHVTFAQFSEIWYVNRTAAGWSLGYNISEEANMDLVGGYATISVDYHDNPQVVWDGQPDGWGPDIYAIWYTNRSAGWARPIIISNATGMSDYSQDFPTITTDLNNYLHVFWDGKTTGYTDHRKVWYANYTTSWTIPICLQPTGETRHPNVRWSRYPAFNRVGFLIDYVFTRKESWDIMYDRELLAPIVHFGIVNPEICGSERWVFEGRTNYIFSLNVSHEGHGDLFSAGVRFSDDAGDLYSFYYSNATGLMTYVNPDDGVSPALRSVSTGTGWLNITFSVMFSPTVADTLDVDVYVRHVTPAWGDSGWVVEEADYFNIYNEGGFSTITKSGWAGRTPGGDTFEIYAADTRTRNLIILENFDVRNRPLQSGVFIPNWGWITVAGDEEELLTELVNWKTWMDTRTVNHTVHPTNRLPDTAISGDKTYYSYPFGLLIKSSSVLNQSLIMERKFDRVSQLVEGEIVTVEFWATVANDTKITGQVLISDDGYVDDLVRHAVTDTKRAVDFKFFGNGSIRLLDGISNIYPATYSGMVWANYTFVLNLTAKTYDFYVDEVLKRANVDFTEAATSVGHISLLDTLNPVFPAQPVEFYVDDLRAWSDWDYDFGGDVKATALYNYLQHWSMDFGFGVEEGREYVKGPTATPGDPNDDYSDYGFTELGWDVCINEIWEENFLVARINITDGVVNPQKNSWIQFNVTWTQNGTYVKNDLPYGLFEGYKIKTSPGAKDVTGFHWDMWFNSLNASTVVGGRINTKYFGMDEESVALAYWGVNWKPLNEITESICFVNLEDSGGTLHSVKEVTMVRPWVRVYRNDKSTFHYAIQDIEELDFGRTEGTMSGIGTPRLRETVSAKAPSGARAFLGIVFKDIMEDFGNSLIFGAMSLWSFGVEMLDVFFGFIGAPLFASQVSGVVRQFLGYVTIILTEGHLYDLITMLFIIPTQAFGHLIYWGLGFINTWVTIGGIVVSILDGTHSIIVGAVNVWDTMNFNEWSDAVPIFMAISWIVSLDSRAKKGVDGVFTLAVRDIQLAFSILAFIMGVMFKALDMFLGTVFRMAGLIKPR